MKLQYVVLFAWMLFGTANAAGQDKVVQRGEAEKIAIAAILKLGGSVIYDEKHPNKPVIGVVLYGSTLTDSGLHHLNAFFHLTSLNLNDSKITDDGLAHLRVLTNLRDLYLGHTNVTDNGLSLSQRRQLMNIRRRITTVLTFATTAFAAMALFELQHAQAGVVTSTGSGSWQTAGNWDGNGSGTGGRPGNGDTVNIQSGDTIQNDFGGGFLDGVYDINVSGSLTDAGVFRVNGSTINVSSTGSLGSGGFWDLDDGTLNFTDGAAVSMSNWGQKDTNVFNFELGSSGFTTLTPNTFRIGNGSL